MSTAGVLRNCPFYQPDEQRRGQPVPARGLGRSRRREPKTRHVLPERVAAGLDVRRKRPRIGVLGARHRFPRRRTKRGGGRRRRISRGPVDPGNNPCRRQGDVVVVWIIDVEKRAASRLLHSAQTQTRRGSRSRAARLQVVPSGGAAAKPPRACARAWQCGSEPRGGPCARALSSREPRCCQRCARSRWQSGSSRRRLGRFACGPPSPRLHGARADARPWHDRVPAGHPAEAMRERRPRARVADRR
jgi:hypothetical protein